MATVGLPAADASRIVGEARSAGASGGLSGHVAGGSPAITHAIGEAFSTGLAHAYLGAAALSLGVIAIGLTCFRQGLPAREATGRARPRAS